MTATLALPFPIDPVDGGALRPPPPAAVGTVRAVRVQQRIDVDDAFDPEILVQADVVSRVVAGDRTSRTWEQTTTPIGVAGWTDYGPVDPKLLADTGASRVRWTQTHDGRVDGFEVLGGPDRAAAAALESAVGAARQLTVGLPDTTLLPGAKWQGSREVTVPLPQPPGDGEAAEPAGPAGVLRLTLRDEHTFVGWSTIDGARTALILTDAHVDGEGIAGHGTHLTLGARSGTWAWIDPGTGAVVYALSTAELSVKAGDGDDDPSVTTIRMSAGPVP